MRPKNYAPKNPLTDLQKDRTRSKKTRAGRKGGKVARELGFPTPGNAPDLAPCKSPACNCVVPCPASYREGMR